MNRLFDDFFRGFGAPARFGEGGFGAAAMPRVDVSETGAEYEVTAVLSAVAPASIACAELKPMRGQAAPKMPSTATVLRRRSSLRRSAGTCWW